MLKPIVLLVAALLPAGPAVASTLEQGLALSSASAALGETVTATSEGWSPGTAVQFDLSGAPVELGTIRADGAGTARLSFVVPATVATGSRMVSASGASPAANATSVIGVALRVTPKEGLALSRASVTRGGTIMATSAGWLPGATVRFAFTEAPSRAVIATADTEGQVTTSLRVPPTLAAGRHTVLATGAVPGINTTLFTSQGVEVTPDDNGEPAPGLVLAGSVVLVIVSIGVGRRVLRGRIGRPGTVTA